LSIVQGPDILLETIFHKSIPGGSWMKFRAICSGILLVSGISICVQKAAGQSAQAGDLMAAYTALHTFTLNGGDAKVSNLTLKRDRADLQILRPLLSYRMRLPISGGEMWLRGGPIAISGSARGLPNIQAFSIVETGLKKASM
jgi:hypothetical protein